MQRGSRSQRVKRYSGPHVHSRPTGRCCHQVRSFPGNFPAVFAPLCEVYCEFTACAVQSPAVSAFWLVVVRFATRVFAVCAAPSRRAAAVLPPGSVRTGVIALKCGMIPDWDKWGVRHPLTVLKLENVQVIQVKTAAMNGYDALQIGAGDAPNRSFNKPELGHFSKAGVEPKRIIKEFRVTPDAVLQPGTKLSVHHFVPGQLLTVTGTSQGKGFQGGMKRWGFAGLRASHGVSVVHRSLGSTGAMQDPGRVWKGKKMPGHMGLKRVTMDGLKLYKIDFKRDLLYLIGSVPGTKGSYVYVKDCLKIINMRRDKGIVLPPFPTGPEAVKDIVSKYRGKQTKLEWVMEPAEHDPFAMHDWDEPEPV